MASGSTMILNGRIEKTDIPTLLRSVEKDKNSGELSFSRGGERIDLYFLFGQLYHAKWGEVVGIDAVTQVLGWTNGNYAFTEGVIPAQASINEDIERILADQSQTAPTPIVERRGAALPPNPTPASNPPTPAYAAPNVSPATSYAGDAGGDMSDLVPFDLASLDSMNAVFPTETPTPSPGQFQAAYQQSMRPGEFEEVPGEEEAQSGGRIAPSPPAGGLYKTRLFCLPTGEQMATSLVATGPQLEEELLHLAEVKFTGYVLGGPDLNGYATVGICLLRGRFVHAFYHSQGQNNLNLVEGERAYRTVLDQRDNRAARFYWFYELPAETMRAAIALLTPPTRYSHLEVRILRFKELLRLLNEESYTGTIRITIPSGALGPDRQPSTLAGERAYIPIYQGTILGLWSERHPRLTNDGQLLQRFLNEPQAFLDLHATAPVAEPGLPLESLVTINPPGEMIGTIDDLSNSRAGGTGGLGARTGGSGPLAQRSGTTGGLAGQRSGVTNDLSRPPGEAFREPTIPIPASIIDTPVPAVDDDERQLRLISSIGRMESTWTQMQKKGKIDTQTMLLALAGFANEVLSVTDSVNGRRNVVEMIQRSLKNELAPYRTIFQLLDIAQGRVNISKLLREYELFNRDGEQSAEDFTREAGKGIRTLLRSTFQHYVSLIRSENVRNESQDMYEVFLSEVVRKM